MAAQKGLTDIVRMLLASGANADAARNDGARPLHIASYQGLVATAKLLLDAGADVNALDNFGHSPLAGASTPAMRALLAARGGV
jgi:ankyrin repeat protein